MAGREALVLTLTNEGDATAPYVERELSARGVRHVRLNTERCGTQWGLSFHAHGPDGACGVIIDSPAGPIAGSSISSVWYRRPLPPTPPPVVLGDEPREFARQEWQSLLDGALLSLDCTWVSHPRSIRVAGHKLLQLRRAQDAGFIVPDTLVSADPPAVQAFHERLRSSGKRMIGKLVSKGPPLASSPEAQYVVFTTLLDEADLVEDDALRSAPVIYQEYVEKDLELRVTVVGDKVFACAIESQATESTHIDWRRYDLDRTPHAAWSLPRACEDACVSLTRRFGLRFSAIDLVVRPDGAIIFLELNPNGQWGWIQDLTGLPIAAALADLLAQPARR